MCFRSVRNFLRKEYFFFWKNSVHVSNSRTTDDVLNQSWLTGGLPPLSWSLALSPPLRYSHHYSTPTTTLLPPLRYSYHCASNRESKGQLCIKPWNLHRKKNRKTLWHNGVHKLLSVYFLKNHLKTHYFAKIINWLFQSLWLVLVLNANCIFPAISHSARQSACLFRTVVQTVSQRSSEETKYKRGT